MRILYGIAFVIPFIFFGYLLARLDKYLAEKVSKENKNVMQSTAIVLGKTEWANQVIERLQEDGVEVLQLTEPFLLKRESNLRCIFALSQNDADNIVLCKIGKKLYNIEAMVSICNERRNEGMFLSEGIPYQLVEKVSVHTLYEAVVPRSGVKS